VMWGRHGGFERFREAHGIAQLPSTFIEAFVMKPEAIAVDHGRGARPVTTGTARVGQVITVLHHSGSLTRCLLWSGRPPSSSRDSPGARSLPRFPWVTPRAAG